jgi:lysophospholipase L1-like esterase
VRKPRAALIWLVLAAAPYFLFSETSTTNTSTTGTSAKSSSSSSNSTAAKKKKKKKTVARRRSVPKPPAVSLVARAQASEEVSGMIDRTAGIPIEYPAAMVPFFEQLRRTKSGEADGPLSILHYGDSHTAADEWTGSVRALLQAQFGDGGGGYSFAGRPFAGYRREDLKSGESRGWQSEGLLSRTGDGLYGLGGISISTTLRGQSVYLEGECSRMELFYLQQPGGGTLRLYDNGAEVDTIATAGDQGPGYFQYQVKAPGLHRFELETLQHAPVRLFGWVTEKDRGVTYETLGINGAQASILFRWDEGILASNIARRNPALIVLAYGTNEASNPDWTQETYREMFSALLQRLRQDAPTASILVLGPPDRDYRSKGRWLTMDKLDRIVAAQREAARANRCAFWDMREKMGGKGSMPEWVTAGLAQYDHVHFTGPGYRRLGYTLFRDLMYNYEKYTKVRAELASAGSHDETRADH